MFVAICIAASMWLGLLLVPWQPWLTREQLKAETPAESNTDFSNLTVLIPARDEASCIQQTLLGLARQGHIQQIILIDDQSSDGTAEQARSAGLANLDIIAGTTPEQGWSGKLWALSQGFERVRTEFVLLLDADIKLDAGILNALFTQQQQLDTELTSVMAKLWMENFWERLLLPPFIYFFKLIYPFALANNPRSRIAAAAGGCVLLKTAALREIGGFAALHDAIIDDCTLAARIKSNGGRTWLGLSQAVRAIRPYGSLANIWNMVARSAFTQLRYSTLLLGVCTGLLLLSFVAPVYGLVSASPSQALVAAVALAAMAISYWPTARFYQLNPAWTITLPLAAVLFLAMTWTSALRYWRGERSRWKERHYERN